MTATLAVPFTPVPAPAGTRPARTDAGVRTVALVAVVAGLALVMYWWAAGGGSDRPGAAGPAG